MATTIAQPDNHIELTDAQIDLITVPQMLRIIDRFGLPGALELAAELERSYRARLAGELATPGALTDDQGSAWLVNHDHQLVSMTGYIADPDDPGDIPTEFLPFTRAYTQS